MSQPHGIIHLQWQAANGDLLHAIDNTTYQVTDRDLSLGVAYPNLVTVPQAVLLRSSASFHDSDEVLTNIRIYLTGDPGVVKMLQEQWPMQGGGLEISFNDGVSWSRFSSGCGYASNPDTWIPLPGQAVSSVARAGQLGPLDTARILIRAQIPTGADTFGLHCVRLGADFDVL